MLEMAQLGRSCKLVVMAGVFLFLLMAVTQCEGFVNVGHVSTAYRAYKAFNKMPPLISSLLDRVSAFRTSRGDYEGAQRIKSIGECLHGKKRWSVFGSMGWDYISHYAWREAFARPSDYADLVVHFNQLISALDEVLHVKSESERIVWISQNHKRVFKIARSICQKLLVIISKSGPLREGMLVLQKEIVDGNLIGDLLELGVVDVKALVQFSKDIIIRLFVPTSTREEFSHSEL